MLPSFKVDDTSSDHRHSLQTGHASATVAQGCLTAEKLQCMHKGACLVHLVKAMSVCPCIEVTLRT